MTDGRSFPDAFECLECGGEATIFETLHWEAVCRYKCRTCGATGHYVRDRPGTLPNIELKPIGLYGAITDDGSVSGSDDTALSEEWQHARMTDHVPHVEEVIEEHPGLGGDSLRIYNRLEDADGEWLKIASPVEAKQ